ncbi:MAG: hypothetical protein ACK5LT_08610 [Lachnospirales bacterium]
MLYLKDFVSMKDLTKEQIMDLLSTAETMKLMLNKNSKNAPYLQGKTVILFFENQQSKNKLAFDLAAKHLSAAVADLSGARNIYANQNIIEVGKMMEEMGADFIVVRHHLSGSSKYLAENVSARVINAGDGQNENPVRSMLDLMTIQHYKGGFNGLKVAFIGDVENNRLAKSNIYALMKLGAKISVCGPPTLISENIFDDIIVYNRPIDAVKDADVIFCVKLEENSLDSKKIPSLNEYKTLFKIDEKLISNAHKDCLVLHPGSVRKGIEITSSIISSDKCVIDVQNLNPIALNMALYYMLSLKGGDK